MQSLKVVVVDDDASVRGLLRVALPLGNVALEVVEEAADGNEAIEVTERLRPDLVILDHMMPHRTGASALPGIRRVSPESVVIFFSAYLDAVETGEALRRASREFRVEAVAKGSLTELEAAVERLAQSRVA